MNMKMNGKLSWAAAALALAGVGSGCGAKAVDIGDDDPPAVLGASLADYEGTWVGYAELAMWNDGTDVIRIVLDENGNGVIEVGNADPLPPPVAGEVYPPSAEGELSADLQPLLISGFSYTVSGATVESKRIRLGSSSSELYSDWCGLFPPVPIDGGYSCLGSNSWDGDGNGLCTPTDMPEAEPISCDIVGCMRICQCDASSCGVLDYGDDIRLDAALEMEGEELEGSLDSPAGRFFVRMTRED